MNSIDEIKKIDGVEVVKYGEDAQYEITVTPNEGYIIESIEINGESIEFAPEEDGSVTLLQFINVRSNMNVSARFKPVEGKVIVHHYEAILNDDGTYSTACELELNTL